MTYDGVINKPDLDEVLEHHGILGMKWGKRNGPPYPLDAGDHSAAEKKAGWRKSLTGDSAANEDRKAKKQQKKELKEAKKKLKVQAKEDKRIEKLREFGFDDYGSNKLEPADDKSSDIKIEKDEFKNTISTTLKNEKGKELYVFGDSRDISDADLKTAVNLLSKNRDIIEKQAFDTLENDTSPYNFYEAFMEPQGMSRKDIRKKLAIQSSYITKINDHLFAEVSIYEKDPNDYSVTGGHSIDFDVDIKNGKLSKHYAVNG